VLELYGLSTTTDFWNCCGLNEISINRNAGQGDDTNLVMSFCESLVEMKL